MGIVLFSIINANQKINKSTVCGLGKAALGQVIIIIITTTKTTTTTIIIIFHFYIAYFLYRIIKCALQHFVRDFARLLI